ncbi:MAG: hypothetical protein M4579_001077 [Chaenotheca gracillima]|nr:MAG: hypothetical protein M4579_001077 [Chaenotheca gracillima]
MHTVRTLDGGMEELFKPSFRNLCFSDDAAMVLVSSHLRLAWTAVPGDDTSTTGVGQFIAASHRRSDDEREEVPQDPDTESVHTPWRDSIHHQWNHVFSDTARFLDELLVEPFRYQPPSHDVYAIDFPASEDNATVRKAWDTAVLIIPAYLAPGVSIRLSTRVADAEGEVEKTLGTFNASNPTDIWYIKKGTTVNVHVEGDYEKGQKGKAAVMACGILSDVPEAEAEVAAEAEASDDD